MVPANHRRQSQGQILVEVSLVLLLVILVFLGAITQLSQVQSRNRRYQFTQEKNHGKVPATQTRK